MKIFGGICKTIVSARKMGNLFFNWIWLFPTRLLWFRANSAFLPEVELLPFLLILSSSMQKKELVMVTATKILCQQYDRMMITSSFADMIVALRTIRTMCINLRIIICPGDHMLLAHARNHGLGMNALIDRMLFRHKRNFRLGLDALVTICSWNMNGIMVWAWMPW